MDKQYKRILVIKLRFHGDMLLTTPVISTLKLNYPDAKIDVLLYEDTMPILSENPEVNALYGIKNRKTSAFEKLQNVTKTISLLRKNNYDLVINLTDQWPVAFLVKCLQAKDKISLQFHHRKSIFWTSCFSESVEPKGTHIVERNLSTLAPLGLQKIITETKMSYQPGHWFAIQQQLSENGVDSQHYVVIQPTARQMFKCWDEEKFSEVIDSLESRGYSVVLTSGPSAADIACVTKIKEHCKIKPVTALAGKTSFPELAALIDHASLFIGVDSAPMHIAAALKTPIVCLFGATDHRFWRPWSDSFIMFWAGDYQPMPTRDNLDRHRKYLSCIPASDVIKATEKLLKDSSDELMPRDSE
ncbi:lipopolysaccharide core heptosyltransferase RfaQ [Hafnia alvei]|uniref:lipopolysaccharide core heptosyltransferase RfaQ n=1 Tax=Hafnia alvei TaxID=569 RepID=UPI000E0EDE63|nr:lipopolysaccharide core heptosyltransferase RfaQ [Hafnia alvei]